jgi:hypothetical protein
MMLIRSRTHLFQAKGSGTGLHQLADGPTPPVAQVVDVVAVVLAVFDQMACRPISTMPRRVSFRSFS